jgi:hypothetical protein
METTMTKFIAELRKTGVAADLIPMDAVSGLPYANIIHGQLCVTIPYYRVTVRPEDQTLIFPFTHTITALWPSGKITSYRDLNYSPLLKKLNFTKPVGTFRHDAVKHLSRQEFRETKSRLLSCYDGYLNCLAAGVSYDRLPEMKKLLNMVMEPGLKPMYLMLGRRFFEPFLEL